MLWWISFVAVAKPLLPIAQRAIEPPVTGRAEGTGNELSPSKTPEPHAISAKHSTAISGDGVAISGEDTGGVEKPACSKVRCWVELCPAYFY